MTKEYLGVNWEVETPFAFCGKRHWNLIPGVLVKKTVDRLNKSAQEYFEALKKQQLGKIADPERYAIYEKATKEILELTLEKFNYAKAANDVECGPALLGELAGEVRDFILNGGKHGMRRLQTKLNTMKGTLSATSQNYTK